MPVAVVTDSTAYLPAELSGAHRLTVVPLTVVINGVEGLEGIEITPAEVARALGVRRIGGQHLPARPRNNSSRRYRRLLDAGADGIVSVHLSAKLSGTVDAALLAAAEVGPQVHVVDSGSTGMGLGFAALAAGAAATRGDNLAAVRQTAVDHAARVSTLFYVDTLEFLRRGGRIGAASALLGTALSVKPILHVVDGAIVVRDKVRTAGRALARLVDLAVEAAGDRRRSTSPCTTSARRTGPRHWPTRSRCASATGCGTATSPRSARWSPPTSARVSPASSCTAVPECLRARPQPSVQVAGPRGRDGQRTAVRVPAWRIDLGDQQRAARPQPTASICAPHCTSSAAGSSAGSSRSHTARVRHPSPSSRSISRSGNGAGPPARTGPGGRTRAPPAARPPGSPAGAADARRAPGTARCAHAHR